MNIKLYSKSGELSPVDSYSNAPAKLMPGAQLKVATRPDNQYHYLFQQFETSYATIRFCNFYSAEKELLTVFSDPAITFHFATQRSHRLMMGYLNMDPFHTRSYNCFYTQLGSVQYAIDPGEIFSFIDVILKPDYAKSIQAVFSEFDAKFQNRIGKRQSALLSPVNHVAPIEALRWIDELTLWAYDANKLSETVEGILKQLIFQSTETFKNNTPKSIIMLSQEEVERIYIAAFDIETSDREFTRNEINELAKQVGLRVYRLMTGFEQIYGYSILKHKSEEKMRKALRYINNKEYSEKVVASMLGFSTAGSFSRKFKNRFGYNPYRTSPK